MSCEDKCSHRKDSAGHHGPDCVVLWRGSRNTEYIGSAHDHAELAALRARGLAEASGHGRNRFIALCGAERYAMTDTAGVPRKRDGGEPGRRPLIDDELADQMLGRAQAGGAELLGSNGLLSQVAKAVLERALAEEMTGHLGHEEHDPAGRGSGNSRNGTTGKTVLTDVGLVDLSVPRDRKGTFEPRIVRKGQTRPGWRVQRPDHSAVCARHDHPGHPRAPARDV